MKKMIKISAVTLLGILVLASCDMRELCYDHYDHDYKYQVNIKADYEQEWQYPLSSSNDWKENWPDTFSVRYSDLLPLLPSGLRVMIYDSLRYDRQNIGRMGGVVYLTEGEKTILFCNNNTETIVFTDERVVDSTSVTTSDKHATTWAIQRTSYNGSSYSPMKDINAKTEPDVLYVGYVPSYIPVSVLTPLDLPVLLKPVVYTYYIRYEFEYGHDYVVKARGALAGMSGSVNLFTQEPGSDLATVMYDAKVKTTFVDAQVRSFGLSLDTASFRSQLNGEYACLLNLEVLLPNGYIKTFEFDANDSILSQFDVTEQILSQPRGGVIVIKGLRVEDEEASRGGEGFEVIVDGWGPYEDIILDF